MKVVFMGTPEIARGVLSHFLEVGLDIALVVTREDKQQGRGRKTGQSPVKQLAEERGLPLLQTEKVSSPENCALISELCPDIIVVVAFGEILSKNILNIPKYGAINLHGSLLPKYRGASPVERALMEGETETGVSIIRLVQKMDAGPVLLKKVLPLSETMHRYDVLKELQLLGQKALLEVIEKLQKGEITEEVQDDRFVTFAPKVSKSEERLDLSLSAKQLHNKVRAVFPNAFLEVYVHETPIILKVITTRVLEKNELALDRKGPGLLRQKNRSFLQTEEGVLELLSVQSPGKQRMEVRQWLCGLRGDVTLGA